jgi:integrase
MACIRTRRGKYIVDYRDAFGVRRWITCRTRRQANRELERALAESHEPRRTTADRDVRVADYAAAWLKLVAPTVKPRTLESYEGAVRLHIVPLLGALKVREVGRGHVKAFVGGKLEEGLARNTVRILHAALHELLGEAVEDGIITANPAARRGRSRALRLTVSPGEREIQAFDRQQLSRLLVAVRQQSPRHYPMFLTMARTGIRLGEAFGLQWQDVNIEGREIRVVRGISGGRVETPKGGKARTVDLSQELRDVLERHDAASKAVALKAGIERQPEAWVFPSLDGTPLDRANVEKAFKRALKHAGLPLHFTPHCLRHSYASLLLQDGVSPAYVQEQLGHSSIKLTVDTYGRWLRKKAPGAVDRLDDAPAVESGSKVVAIATSRPRRSRQVVVGVGGPRGARTRDLLIANQALSQLS